MIFAAGFGTRMGPLTADRPKPLLRVGGRALLDHAVAPLMQAGVKTIAVNAHYKAEMIADHLQGTPGAHLIREDGEILETGGGLRNALPVLGTGPVFTMNSDAVWTDQNPAQELLNVWQPQQMGALLLLVPKDRATGYQGDGDFGLSDDGMLRRGGPFVYTGAQILHTDGLHDISDTAFSLNRLWDDMLATGRLFGTVHSGGWCDVGRPEGIDLANAMLAKAGVDV